jgi:hypothetical protein
VIEVRDFSVDITDAQIKDLRERLARARLPEAETVDDRAETRAARASWPPVRTHLSDGAGWSVNAIAEKPASSAARANRATVNRIGLLRRRTK